MSEFLIRSLDASTIFTIAALGELIGQRSGVLNVGIEGVMLQPQSNTFRRQGQGDLNRNGVGHHDGQGAHHRRDGHLAGWRRKIPGRLPPQRPAVDSRALLLASLRRLRLGLPSTNTGGRFLGTIAG